MTRTQRKSLRKTAILIVKLALLAVLFWGGIQPVFTDLFKEEPIEQKEPTAGYKTKVSIQADSVWRKTPVFYRIH